MLTVFARVVDAQRLATDEGDRSRQALCCLRILRAEGAVIRLSCGTTVTVDASMESTTADDCLVVGGLLHGGQEVPMRVDSFLRETAAHGVKLVGL